MRHPFCKFIACKFIAAFIGPGLLCYSVGASAELGGHVSTIATEQVRIKATLRTQNIADTRGGSTVNYSVHELTTEIGTVIREYADAGGTVFAVTWQGPAKPDLDMLLGQYFQTFSAAPSQPGTGPKQINQPELIVFSGGHPRAFIGRAYLPGLIPTGVDINALP